MNIISKFEPLFAKMWPAVEYCSEFRFRPVSSGGNFKKFRPVPVPAGTFKFGSGAPLVVTILDDAFSGFLYIDDPPIKTHFIFRESLLHRVH